MGENHLYAKVHVGGVSHTDNMIMLFGSTERRWAKCFTKVKSTSQLRDFQFASCSYVTVTYQCERNSGGKASAKFFIFDGSFRSSCVEKQQSFYPSSMGILVEMLFDDLRDRGRLPGVHIYRNAVEPAAIWCDGINRTENEGESGWMSTGTSRTTITYRQPRVSFQVLVEVQPVSHDVHNTICHWYRNSPHCAVRCHICSTLDIPGA